MMTPLPGAARPSPAAHGPLLRREADVVRKDGSRRRPNEGGLLVLKRPWPSMLRTVWGDDERFRSSTTSATCPGCYFTGDGARRDEDGYFWVMGRVDDVLNVAGHRLGTAEIESALVSHRSVAEAAVVGRPDDLKGQALVAS
jgi:acetyl-CoA synthetase